jgi:hypothetical protein
MNHRAKAVAIAMLGSAASCSPRGGVLGTPANVADSLPIVSRVSIPAPYRVSDAVMLDDCSIVFVGGEWGNMVRIAPDGSVLYRGRIPGARENSHLYRLPDGNMLAWSAEPSYLGRVDRHLRVSSYGDLPAHRQVTGPVQQKAERFVFTTVGERSRAGMLVAPDAPRVTLTDASFLSPTTVGQIPLDTNAALALVQGRTASTLRADTLELLDLYSGVLTAWLPPYATPVRTDTLPHYLESPTPRAETWTYPWLQYGPVVTNTIHVAQVGSAVFTDDGHIYAERVHEARWRKLVEPYLKTQGRWNYTSRTLEEYTIHGDVIRRFAVPAMNIQWLSASPTGHLLMRVGQQVFIANMSGSAACDDLPRSMTLAPFDSAPSPTAFVESRRAELESR